MKKISALALIALSHCTSPNDPGEGGVTKQEAEELNAIAASLDASNETVPSVANTPIPVVPLPPPDPALDKVAN